MAILTVQDVTPGGLGPTFVAASATGDSFANTGREVLHVTNGGASAITVTVDSAVPCNYGFDHDITVSVPAGGERIIGPFPPARFNDPNGNVNITYFAVTSVTVAVYRV